MTLINIGLVILIASFIPEATDADNRSTAGRSINQVSASLLELPSERPTILAVHDNGRTKAGRLTKTSIPARSVPSRKAVDPAVQDFISEISEARIMDREEGKLAAQRGTSRSIKDYGKKMVEDQTEMLKELKEIASERDLKVESELGKRKAMGLSDLEALHGKNFDSKFVRMMIVDHRRDIRKLEKATRSDDADIQVFATKYLPVVQKHLEEIEAIKKELKK